MKTFVLPTIFTAVDKFSSKVIGMGKSLDSFISKASKAQRKLDNTFSSMGGNVVAGGVVAGVGLATLAVKKFITEASKIENAEAFFTPVLGSAQKAAQLVDMLNKEAAVTPFRFEDLSHVASSLLPLMNGDLNKTVATFRLLGDTAGGSVDKLNRITLGYTKALLKQKVTLESLNIIAEAGVPIFTEMAKSMGLFTMKNGKMIPDVAKLFKMITAGKVSADALTKTFEDMGKKGGLFYKGMITASTTFSGITSTLEDNVSMTAASIGKELLPMAKEYALKAIEITGKIREWVGQNKELIASKFKEFLAGAVEFSVALYKAAIFIYNNWSTIITVFKIYVGLLIAMKAASLIIGITTTAMNLLSIAIWLVEAAQWSWGTAQAVSLALQGKTILFLEGNAVAMGIYKVAMALSTAATWIATKAQLAWNVAMTANPIGLIIIGIAALIVLIVAIVKYYDQWGAALTFLLGPLGMVINLVMSFVRNWDYITKSFKEGGVLQGFKAIGVVILDALLYPLQQVLEIVGKLTGADWATNMAKQMKAFRAELGVGGAVVVDAGKERENMVTPLSAAEEERTDREMAMKNIVQPNSNINLNINNGTNNKISAQSDNNLININMKSRMLFGQ